MFPHRILRCHVSWAAIAVLLCLSSTVCRAQDPQAVNVKFAFRLSDVDTRFEQVSEMDVEKEGSTELAKSCGNRFPFWIFQSTADAMPRLDVWLSRKNSTWYLNASLIHPTGRDLKDKWTSVLYSPGDLDTQVLPKDRAWTSTIKATFENLIASENSNEILTALQEFAPLGTQMAAVPAQLTAVLPLDYGRYQALSLSNFRIMCQWAAHGVVTLHSTGVGAPNDFTPEVPKFKGIWVLHNFWEFGGHREDVSGHQSDLPSLTTLAVYLEQVNSPPPQVSVAP
ncbi:MAG TPA: hypothetical protein VE398_12075 [Acidobacteriota bacterium]|nr:hypothetical protein [Acidobacteriota bacterium]